MTLGPLLILLNNHILHGLHFPYPIALSALGVTFSAACCRLLTLTRLVPLTRPELAQSRAFFWRTTLPLAALAALTLALGPHRRDVPSHPARAAPLTRRAVRA